MAKGQESPGLAASKLESVIQDYKESIKQALEDESNELRERAERNSSQIVAMAREEAEKIIAKSRKKASNESQKQTAKIISETKRKMGQIIAEAIANSATGAKDEFGRAVSQARNKLETHTSRVFAELTSSIDQIVGEMEANAAVEAKRLANAIAEAEGLPPDDEPDIEEVTGETEAVVEAELEDSVTEEIEDETEPPLNKKQDEETRVNPRATEQAVTPEDSVSGKIAAPAPSARHQRGAPIEEGDQLFKGRLQLEVVPPFNQERENGQEWLSRVPGLKILATSGYTGSNRWITTHSIDLEQPVPLLKILKNMVPGKDVTERKGNIVITLK